MASLPGKPAQPAQPNSSPSNQRQIQADPSPIDESTAPSMASEDSQTVLLDNPVSPSHRDQARQSSLPRPSPPSRSSTLGIKKCWICICDSTEDDPQLPLQWRSPCTCNLTAHEACLLDWVADLENPRNRRGGPPMKIQCPQCKSEIKIARPRSLVLTGLRAWERWTATLTLPGMVMVLGGTLWAGCFYHGVHSVGMVFGEPQASHIYDTASQHWGGLMAYALVPVNLIAAQTSYADWVLPVPMVFLVATRLTDGFNFDWTFCTFWAPRPATAFSCLIVARSCYYYLYDKAFSNLNRKWLKEIQPRQSQGSIDGDGNEADGANGDAGAAAGDIAEGDILLELNAELGVEDGEDEEEQHQQQGARDERRPGHQEAQLPNNVREGAEDAPLPAAEGAADDNQAANANANNNNAPPPALLNRRRNEIITDTSSIFLKTLGALIFPTIAAGVGEILHHTLPLSWVRPTPCDTMLSNNGRELLLRTRWGRSVVGGCLFVVLKDALVLYVRWKMAKNHRGRRIMDFDKKRKEYVLGD